MSARAERSILPVASAVAYAVLLIVCFRAPQLLGGVGRVVAEGLQYIPLVAFAAWTFGQAAVHHRDTPRLHQALLIFTGAIMGLGGGMALYVYMHEVAGQATGAANIGDPVYLVAYAALVAALVRLPKARGSYQRWMLVLDAVTSIVAVSILIWLFVIVPTTRTPKSTLDFVVTIAYPLLDLALLLTLNTVLLIGGPATHRRAFRWLTFALVTYVAADSCYQLAFYGSGFDALGPVSEIGYSLAYVLLVVAGWRYGTNDPEDIAPRPVPEQLVSPLPLLGTALVSLVLLFESLHYWDAPLSALALGMVCLTAVLLVRQSLTASQNASLREEQAARLGEARIAALTRHATDLIAVCDGDGRFTFVSPSSQAILGVAPETLMGRALAELIHPDDLADLPALGVQLDANSGSATYHWRLRHADGTWRPMETIATDLRHEPGIGGIVLATRDLTERTHLETQLRQAQKMEVVGRLAGGVAHDFNNLLTTVLASTELLLDQVKDIDAMHDDLVTIRQAASRAAALTGQLLAFSRQQVLTPRPVDFRALLRDTLRMFGRLADASIRVDVQTDDGLPRVLGDPNQLSQVILNLTMNARDAMPYGGTLTLRLRRERLAEPLPSPYLAAPPGDYVVLALSDTGMGMDPATRDRLFEPFFTTKPAGKGTGLGLATTLSILEQHRGGIMVDSTPGGGTRIEVWLPATDDAVAAESAAAAEVVAAAPTGRERVLVVEDETALRHVAHRILERLGYQVETASDAAQARRVISVDGPPALLLTDIIMPGESGPQLAVAMRRQFPDLRVLFMSGYTGDELGRYGLVSGELAFLQKPFTPRELAERVREVLDAPSSLGW